MSKDKSNFSGNKQQQHQNPQQQQKQQVRPEHNKPGMGQQQQGGWSKPGMGNPNQGQNIGKGQFPGQGQQDRNKK